MDTASRRPADTDDASTTVVSEPLATRGEVDFRIIELFFFAYRQFTADADLVLAQYGFGRAHHRVLHFVNRAPGMTVADILELLEITKQSLSRVLRQLLDGGFVEQVQGSEDRRQRHLYPTKRGRELTLELSRAQAKRIEAALQAADADDPRSVTRFLLEMAGERDATTTWFRRQGIDTERECER